MKCCLQIVLLAVQITCIGVTATIADEKPKGPEPILIEKTTVNHGTDQRIRLARKLIKSKDYTGASAVLESVYEVEPDNPTVINLLKRCYDRLKLYPKSTILAQRLVERFPNSYSHRMSLAELYILQDKKDSAEIVYRTAIDLSGEKLDQISIVIAAMVKNGLDQTAQELAVKFRHDLNNPTLFALSMGRILIRQKKYTAAVLELFPVLEDTTNTASQAEKQLFLLLDFPESAAETEKTLLELSARAANLRAMRLLSSFYLKSDRFAEAYRFAILQDSLENSRGQILARFMRSCYERHLYGEAVKMGEYLLKKHGHEPLVANSWFIYADALTGLGLYNEAIAILDTIVNTFPLAQDRGIALYRIGMIQMDYLGQLEQALVSFDSVISSFRGGLGRLEAQMARGYCYLRMGDRLQARNSFDSLSHQRLNKDISEEVNYNLAMIDFFSGDYDSAKVALRKLMVDYPRGLWVNDVIQLLTVMGDAEDSPLLLNDFTAAVEFEYRKMPDSSRTRLKTLVENPDSTLADVALHRLIRLDLEQVDSSATLAHIGLMIERFPESYYLPYALKLKADMLIGDSASFEEAKTIYRHLLEDYPNYPFISKVRKSMRKIELDSQIG